jgi:hypothetical protein
VMATKKTKQPKVKVPIKVTLVTKKTKKTKEPKAKKEKVQTVQLAVAEAPSVAVPPPMPEPHPEPVPLVVLTPEEKAAAAKAAKQARMYFNQNTQACIVAYQQAKENKKERDRLYVTGILPAFNKLVENLINIHKFTSLHDTYDDLKCDCVNFLFETIGKFDGNRGTNAFSYFNVVAKNWLIIRTKQKSQRVRRSVSLDDPEALSANEQRIIEDYSTIPSQDLVLENESSAKAVVGMLYEIHSKVKTENELACINSIITIFENIDDIDLLNKSAILLYMRELSGLSPKQLTTTMQAVKKQYRRLKFDPKFRLFG